MNKTKLDKKEIEYQRSDGNGGSVASLIFENMKVSIVLSVIICAVMSIFIFFWSGSGKLELLVFFGIFIFGLLVGYPSVKFLFLLKLQEHDLGIRYKDRNDHSLSWEKKAWFLVEAGTYITLIHRDYIQKVVKIFVDKQNGSANHYRVVYLDCKGRKRSFLMEHLKSEAESFKKWYSYQVVEVEEDEDDIYLEDEPDKEEGTMNYTYMVRCIDGSLYTGWTNNLEKRIQDHNEGRGAKYTKGRGPVELVYSEIFDTKEEAMKREYQIKHMKRKEKEGLMNETRMIGLKN